MKSDTFHHIGTSHSYCEDYSTSGITKEGRPFVVVCDGCSSGHESHIGSLLVGNAARAVLSLADDGDISNYDFMATAIMTRAQMAAQPLGLDDRILETTMIFAVEFEKVFWVAMYGDGYVISKSIIDTIGYTEINFLGNAPYYPVNFVNFDFRKRYFDNIARTTSLTRKWTNCFCVDNEFEHEELEPEDYKDPLFFVFEKEEYQTIAIATDGFAHFQERNQAETTEEIVIREAIDFKNYNGHFVKRRLTRVLEDFEKVNIKPYDDIAMGVLHKGK